MRHLKELGLDLKEDAIIFKEGIPLYALQDILDALPKVIYTDNEYWLQIGMMNTRLWFIAYMDYDLDSPLQIVINEELIDAAYELLYWTIKNGYRKNL